MNVKMQRRRFAEGLRLNGRKNWKDMSADVATEIASKPDWKG